MKKLMITESQAKRLIENVVKEQNQTCLTDSLYNILNKSQNINFQTETAKFKITGIRGNGVKFNGKPFQNGYSGGIITPKTQVTLCINDVVMLSGMGLPECGLTIGNDGIIFVPQFA
jgi:hypothetical protein